METAPMFNSVEDECRYWKERAKFHYEEWKDIKQEYDEYVEQSRQMEAEMDATLEQKQSVIKDLKFKLASYEKENESLKFKIESHTIELANMEKLLDNMKKDSEAKKEYIQQLEQKNDDLERAHRIVNESIADFEQMLDKAYEKNALLEMEVDEKEILKEKMQRLMDEARDLKQELNIKARYPILNGSANNSTSTITTTTASTTLTNGINVSNGDISYDATTPTRNNVNNVKRKSFADPESLLNGNAMTASNRTTALNIVADMLRKLNLDTLLCPHCERFRCVCERPAFNDYEGEQLNATPNTTNTNSSLSRFGRSLRSTFSGSNHSVGTNASSPASTATTPSTDGIFLQPQQPAQQQQSHLLQQQQQLQQPKITLSRSPSCHSNNSSNLNFGTNIFKRFAERMNRNSNPLASPQLLPTASSCEMRREAH